jgi:hypothetical protein
MAVLSAIPSVTNPSGAPAHFRSVAEAPSTRIRYAPSQRIVRTARNTNLDRAMLRFHNDRVHQVQPKIGFAATCPLLREDDLLTV